MTTANARTKLREECRGTGVLANERLRFGPVPQKIETQTLTAQPTGMAGPAECSPRTVRKAMPRHGCGCAGRRSAGPARRRGSVCTDESRRMSNPSRLGSHCPGLVRIERHGANRLPCAEMTGDCGRGTYLLGLMPLAACGDGHCPCEGLGCADGPMRSIPYQAAPHGAKEGKGCILLQGWYACDATSGMRVWCAPDPGP